METSYPKYPYERKWKSLSLNTCLKIFGLPREPDPHNALTGAKCNVALFNSVMTYDGSDQVGIF